MSPPRVEYSLSPPSFDSLEALEQAVGQCPALLDGACEVRVRNRMYEIDQNHQVHERQCWFRRMLRYCFGDRAAHAREQRINHALQGCGDISSGDSSGTSGGEGDHRPPSPQPGSSGMSPRIFTPAPSPSPAPAPEPRSSSPAPSASSEQSHSSLKSILKRPGSPSSSHSSGSRKSVRFAPDTMELVEDPIAIWQRRADRASAAARLSADVAASCAEQAAECASAAANAAAQATGLITEVAAEVAAAAAANAAQDAAEASGRATTAANAAAMAASIAHTEGASALVVEEAAKSAVQAKGLAAQAEARAERALESAAQAQQAAEEAAGVHPPPEPDENSFDTRL